MTTLQKKILSRYLEINRNPTLRFMAEDTQIQITRVFRILNGSEMRISEFQKFEKSIKNKVWGEKKRDEKEFYELTKKCASELSRPAIQDLMDYMMRKIKLKGIGESYEPDLNGGRK